MSAHPSLGLPIFNHRLLLAAVILTVAGTTIATRNGSALSTQPMETQQAGLAGDLTVSTDLGGFVQRAIQANASARSLSEWQESGYLPGEIVSHARSRVKLDVDAIPALCRVLASLSDEHLALFSGHLRTLPVCGPRLARRLNGFWASASARLGESSGGIALSTQEQPVSLPHPTVSQGQVALVFVGGPHPQLTPRILATLKDYGVRAHFFNIGALALAHPALVREQADAGHVVASAGNQPGSMSRLPVRELQASMTEGRKRVSSAAGLKELPFFRTPNGDSHLALSDSLREQRMIEIPADLDSQDWKRTDPADLLQHLMAQLDRAHGGTILLHDTYEQTAIALPHLLDYIARRGLKPVVFVPR